MWKWLHFLQPQRRQATTKFPGVVVGRVLAVQQHPRADRLKVTVVDVGAQQLTIVCGAPNVAAGQLVAVALPGATLANDLTIRPVVLRGTESQGMICAVDELGIGRTHDIILVLDSAAVVGGPIDGFVTLTA